MRDTCDSGLAVISFTLSVDSLKYDTRYTFV